MNRIARDPTPLHLARRKKHLNVICLLLENGASTKLKNSEGQLATTLVGQHAIDHVLEEWPFQYSEEINKLKNRVRESERGNRHGKKRKIDSVEKDPNDLDVEEEEKDDDDNNNNNDKESGEQAFKMDNLSSFVDNLLLAEESEKECPLHAAIPYGYKEDIEAAIEEGEEHKGSMNKLDSKKRTAMDLAPLTGQQTDVVHMLASKGGQFRLQGKAKMVAIARARAPVLASYLQHVRSKVDFTR